MNKMPIYIILFCFLFFSCNEKSDDNHTASKDSSAVKSSGFFEGTWENTNYNFNRFIIEKVGDHKYKLTLNGDDYGFGILHENELQFRLVFATAYLRPIMVN